MTDVDGVMEAAQQIVDARHRHEKFEGMDAVERAAKLAVYDGIVAVLREMTCIWKHDTQNPTCVEWNNKFPNLLRSLCDRCAKLAEYEALAAEVRG